MYSLKVLGFLVNPNHKCNHHLKAGPWAHGHIQALGTQLPKNQIVQNIRIGHFKLSTKNVCIKKYILVSPFVSLPHWKFKQYKLW